MGERLVLLFTREEIASRVRDLAATINAQYAGRDLVLVGILRGAFVFLADLLRHLTIPTAVDFIGAASYGCGSETSGQVLITKDLQIPIRERDVLLVEDIVDSGLTLAYLIKNLRTRRPASLEVCALLQKEGVQQVPLEIKYRGFTIPPDFVVGYGLDFSEQYRHLPHIVTLKPEVYGGAIP